MHALAVRGSVKVLYGLARMWETLAERPGLVTRVVKSRAEAAEWLQHEVDQPVLPFDGATEPGH